jgi:DNA-binding MurR/RpiR family transcriptional regulator
MDSVLEAIRSSYTRLRGAKRKFIEFAIANPETVAFMDIETIAKKSGVSSSTISRTATEIGLQGFPELQKTLRNELKRRFAPKERFEIEQRQLSSEDSGVIESIKKDILNINIMMENLPLEDIQQVSDMISNARKVFVASFRSSYGAGHTFVHLLNYIRDNVFLVTAKENRIPEQLMDVSDQDVLIAIAFPRYSKLTASIQRYVKKKGCKTVAITDSNLSPISLQADYSFHLPYESSSFFISFAPTTVFINSLLTRISISNKAKLPERLELINQTLNDLEIIVKN